MIRLEHGVRVGVAGDLPPQVHLGREDPVCEKYYTPPCMTVSRPLGVASPRPFNEPGSGGFWTSELMGPADAHFARALDRLCSGWAAACRWTLIVPGPDAPILVITGSRDAAAVLERWRYRDSNEIDFVAVAEAGFAGVALVRDPRRIPAFRDWQNDRAVFWLRWSVRHAVTLKDAQETDVSSPMQPTYHEELTGKCRGFWFDWGPPPLKDARLNPALIAYNQLRMKVMEARNTGAQSVEEVEHMRDLLRRTHLAVMVQAHNLVDERGCRLPLGKPLARALPPSLAQAMNVRSGRTLRLEYLHPQGIGAAVA